MLSENQREALKAICNWPAGTVGPAPGSQTNGDFLTAEERNALFDAGLLEAIPADISDDVPSISINSDKIEPIRDAPYLATHYYRVTQAGRKALEKELADAE